MKRNLLPWLAGVLLLGSAAPAMAHVKWFSQSADLEDVPLTLGAILTPTFYALAAASVAVVIVLTLLDDPLQKLSAYKRLRTFLSERESSGGVVMRIATGMTLLLCWQGQTLLAPDLGHDLALVPWLQFAAILLLFDRRTTPVAGMFVAVLYGLGVAQFGLFHMLDYAAFLGVAFYLVFHELDSERPAVTRLKAWVKPALFGMTGLSLAWLALEKLVFPTWGIAVLEDNPALMMNLGLSPSFFLTACAFIEFSLGFLLLLGVLGRPLALIITLVFFLTTMVFGKDEVIGHLILHGVLVVFMLEGTSGRLAPPFRFHRRIPLRVAFVGVNFVVMLGVMLFGYQQLATPRAVAPIAGHGARDAIVAATDAAPSVTLSATPTDAGDWRLHLGLERFVITPMGDAKGSESSADDSVRRGHAHLFVDGEMKGMIFEDQHVLSGLSPGEHVITVQLSTMDHRTIMVGGKPAEASLRLVQRGPDRS